MRLITEVSVAKVTPPGGVGSGLISTAENVQNHFDCKSANICPINANKTSHFPVFGRLLLHTPIINWAVENSMREWMHFLNPRQAAKP